MKKTYGDIDGENSFIKFELNPITIKGPKLGGKFFGPVKTRASESVESDFCNYNYKGSKIGGKVFQIHTL